jgi:uncharacterized protein (DUF2336 family)
MMTEQRIQLDFLDGLIAGKGIGHRADALRRITDLFVSISGNISDDQVGLFDSVMVKLVEEIDVSARATFSSRIASMSDTPPDVVRMLALDDDIEVAEPVLTNSGRLDEATLVEGARTKSQDHLLAISRRTSLPEVVTDVLVDRGNREVVMSTASNRGARFSEFGYSTLVRKSETDGDLAAQVWARPDIPRQHLLELFADASEAVQSRFGDVDRNKGCPPSQHGVESFGTDPSEIARAFVRVCGGRGIGQIVARGGPAVGSATRRVCPSRSI